MPLQKILVATDFSPVAEQAIMRAAKLGEGAPVLEIVHVLHPARGKPDSEATRQLAQAATLARTLSPRSSVSARLLRGPTVQAIVQHLKESGADLVVCGRHGQHLLRDLFLGSTAERLLHEAGTSILLVNRPVHAPYAKALFAVDAERASWGAVDLAMHLLSPDKTLKLVHAYRPVLESSILGLTDVERSNLRKEGKRSALESLLPFRRALLDNDVPHDLVLRRGEPGEVLLHEIKKRHVDLVVLGTHARSRVGQVLLGSIVSDILREAPCDVLIVRPRADRLSS